MTSAALARRRKDEFKNSTHWRQIIVKYTGWLGSRVVSVLDSGAVGPGFKSQSRRCRVTVLGKLFTSIMPLFIKQRKVKVAGFMTHVTCRLTAKNRDQLWNPTLGKKAKFHYTDPHGPARTFLRLNSVGSVRFSDKVRAGSRGSV